MIYATYLLVVCHISYYTTSTCVVRYRPRLQIRQKAYTNRRRLKNPAMYARKQRKKKREEDNRKNKDKNKDKNKKKNKTEAFHSFYQSIVPFILEMCVEFTIAPCALASSISSLLAPVTSLLKSVTTGTTN
jgi:hypothetical protein